MLLILPLVTVVPLVLGIVIIAVYGRTRGPMHPACGKCGYDVRASVMHGSDAGAARCPECGSALMEVGIIPPATTGPRRNMVALGIVLIAGSLGCIASMIPLMAYTRAAQPPQGTTNTAPQNSTPAPGPEE